MKAHKRIRAYREAHNIAPGDLAERLGVAESTLRSIENGNRQVKDPDLAVRIERETGVSRAEFFPQLFAGMAT